MDAWKVAYKLLKDQRFDSYNVVTFQLKQKVIKIIHNVLLFQSILVSVLITTISILVQVLERGFSTSVQNMLQFQFLVLLLFQ